MKFNDEEDERCPKTSPLTLTGFLKAPVESQEGERRENPTGKRKGVETEVEMARETEELRDQVPKNISNEGESSEEKGGFEADLEKLVPSPIADHGVPSQTRADERREESEIEKGSSVEQLFKLKQRSRGKMRATTEDSNNSELPAMLKEMKEQLKERDEKIREELRWRYNYLEDEIKEKKTTP